MGARLRLAPSPDRGADPDANQIRVFLADPHPGARRSLRLLLDREHDLRVIAETGELSTVAPEVRRRRPDVLVLDLQMQHGSSIEMARKLREQIPETEIVVLTMEISAALAYRALMAGAVGFVLKDQADEELPAAIRAAARGDEYVSSQVASGLDAIRRAATPAPRPPAPPPGWS